MQQADFVRVEQRVVIARPAWEVFTFVANAENEVLWRPRALYVRKTYDGPMGLDATYWYVARRFAGRSTGLLRVTAYEPDTLVTFAGSFDGGRQPTDTYGIDTVAPGTRVAAIRELRVGRMGRLFRPQLFFNMSKEAHDDLGRLKRLLEDPARIAAPFDALRG